MAFVGCSSGDDDDDDNGSAGKGPSAGQSNAGSAGNGTAGSSAGNAAGGKAGNNAGGNPGSAGNGGTAAGGKGGSGGAANGGKGGTAPNGGAMSEGGAGGAGPEDCMEDAIGGAGQDDGSGGDGPGIDTAVVLLDNVVVKKAAVAKWQWQFDDAKQISDSYTPTNPGDKWSRYFYGDPASKSGAGARNPFSKCDGSPAPGSLKSIIPFTAANQYYELDVPFAVEDYTDYVISARVKLVSGGKPDAACPARAGFYIVGANTNGAINGPGVALKEDTWVDVTMTVAAATGTDKIDRLGLNVNTYACQ